jgi:hypothetical protein
MARADPKITLCYAQTRESEEKVLAQTRFFLRVSRQCSIAATLGAAANLAVIDTKA